MTAILVAGIGNIFNGDDAFGVEVAQRLMRRPQPHGVKIVDFGIRGLDLTYALLDGFSAAILIDAAARGERPGTVTIVEPTIQTQGDLQPEDLIVSGHDLDPAKVLQVVSALGGGCRRIVLVACEPLDLGGEDGAMGLSPAVAAAIEPAVVTVERLIADFLKTQGLGEAA
ncbi:MAG TPA: hydrogenase maturation protease [Alphaproteobacteria bacterium]|jgi:hydrogenase maturation protease|nr:hydrogenase maturation protease [Alphaproteobacteria bacterium]